MTKLEKHSAALPLSYSTSRLRPDLNRQPTNHVVPPAFIGEIFAARVRR
jgi:hypothetical protein